MTDDVIDFVVDGIDDGQCLLFFYLEMEVSRRINKAIKVLNIPAQDQQLFKNKAGKKILHRGLNALRTL